MKPIDKITIVLIYLVPILLLLVGLMYAWHELGAVLGLLFLLLMLIYLWKSRGEHKWTVLTVLCLVLIFPFFYVALNIGVIRPLVRQYMCHEQLREIQQALYRYQSQKGSLPPLYTINEAGDRLVSWRVLLLPDLYAFSGAGKEYNAAFDLTLPWDHPKNLKAASSVSVDYQCSSPSHTDSTGRKVFPYTNYVAVDQSDWGKPLLLDPDDMSEEELREKKLFLIEIPESKIPWHAPYDLKEWVDTLEVNKVPKYPHALSCFPLMQRESLHVLYRNGEVESVSLKWRDEEVPGRCIAEKGAKYLCLDEPVITMDWFHKGLMFCFCSGMSIFVMVYSVGFYRHLKKSAW